MNLTNCKRGLLFLEKKRVLKTLLLIANCDHERIKSRRSASVAGEFQQQQQQKQPFTNSSWNTNILVGVSLVYRLIVSSYIL